jgi:hypothetical protein
MRAVLALGLLMAAWASASAAPAHRVKPRVRSPPVSSHDFVARPIPGWDYAVPRPDLRFNDTPSYNDPSKFGGGAP